MKIYEAIGYAFICALISGCATPRVWVQSTTENGGVIGYQDYDPSSDKMRRITNLIPCSKFKKTWNGIKSQSTGTATYMYNQYPTGGGMMIPLDNGVMQWAEYHYECIREVQKAADSRPKYFSQDMKTNVAQCRNEKNSDWEACLFLAGYYRYEIKDEDAAKSTLKYICESAPADHAVDACNFMAAGYRIENDEKNWKIFLQKSCEKYSAESNREQLSPIGCAFHHTLKANYKLAERYIMLLEETCINSSKPGECYDLACLYSLQKNRKKSIEFLSEALTRGYKDWSHIESDPDLAFLRADSSYKVLLEKYK